MNDRSRKPKLEFSRRSLGRPKLPTILIVCEDKKATQAYFDWLAEKVGVKNNIKTRQAKKYYQPDNLVQYAKSQKQIGVCTKVFCVFDKDNYDDGKVKRFSNAVKMFKEKGMNGIVDAHSVPCFEFWLLLHFIYTTALMSQQEVENQLKRHGRLPNYNKGKKNLGLSADELNHNITGLYARLEIAREGAERSLAARREGEESSYTKVQAVVDEILRISDIINAR